VWFYLHRIIATRKAAWDETRKFALTGKFAAPFAITMLHQACTVCINQHSAASVTNTKFNFQTAHYQATYHSMLDSLTSSLAACIFCSASIAAACIFASHFGSASPDTKWQNGENVKTLGVLGPHIEHGFLQVPFGPSALEPLMSRGCAGTSRSSLMSTTVATLALLLMSRGLATLSIPSLSLSVPLDANCWLLIFRGRAILSSPSSWSASGDPPPVPVLTQLTLMLEKEIFSPWSAVISKLGPGEWPVLGFTSSTRFSCCQPLQYLLAGTKKTSAVRPIRPRSSRPWSSLSNTQNLRDGQAHRIPGWKGEMNEFYATILYLVLGFFLGLLRPIGGALVSLERTTLRLLMPVHRYMQEALCWCRWFEQMKLDGRMLKPDTRRGLVKVHVSPEDQVHLPSYSCHCGKCICRFEPFVSLPKQHLILMMIEILCSFCTWLGHREWTDFARTIVRWKILSAYALVSSLPWSFAVKPLKYH
jgi:hypothetical protein